MLSFWDTKNVSQWIFSTRGLSALKQYETLGIMKNMTQGNCARQRHWQSPATHNTVNKTEISRDSRIKGMFEKYDFLATCDCFRVVHSGKNANLFMIYKQIFWNFWFNMHELKRFHKQIPTTNLTPYVILTDTFKFLHRRLQRQAARYRPVCSRM